MDVSLVAPEPPFPSTPAAEGWGSGVAPGPPGGDKAQSLAYERPARSRILAASTYSTWEAGGAAPSWHFSPLVLGFATEVADREGCVVLVSGSGSEGNYRGGGCHSGGEGDGGGSCKGSGGVWSNAPLSASLGRCDDDGTGRVTSPGAFRLRFASSLFPQELVRASDCGGGGLGCFD